MEKGLLARAMKVFESVVDLPANERWRVLTESCGQDDGLLDYVRRMLAAHDEAAGGSPDSPVRLPASDGDGDSTRRVSDDASSSPSSDRDRIGSYRLREKIGECGFGEVYLADQLEPVRRRVPLEILKADRKKRYRSPRHVVGGLFRRR